MAQWDGVIELADRTNRGFAQLAVSGQVVVGVAGKKIRVLGFIIGAASATSVKFQSDVTDISGSFPLAANGGLTAPESQTGWFETAVGEALNLNMSAATNVGVQVIYVYI